MPKFDIWIPSFTDQGMEGRHSDPSKANKEPVEAETFHEAVRIYARSKPAEEARYWHEDGDRWLMWGLTVCPTEEDTWNHTTNPSRPNRR